jgi:hypothetical protein
MGDLGGMKFVKGGASQMKELAAHSITSMVDLLVNRLGFDIKNFRISYHPGGTIRHITKDKYTFDKYIPSDPMIEHWYSLGFSEANFIPEISRNTVLALNNFEFPSPWGYRNEIHYIHNDQLLDIATIEQCYYRPIFGREREIINLTDWDHAFVAGAIGVERVLMVANGLDSVHELDHIQSLNDRILSGSTNQDVFQAICLNETLRPIHAILCDTGTYSDLSRNRKDKFRQLIRNVQVRCRNLGIELTAGFLEDYFALNAKLQSYYPELTGNIESMSQEILAVGSRLGTSGK